MDKERAESLRIRTEAEEKARIEKEKAEKEEAEALRLKAEAEEKARLEIERIQKEEQLKKETELRIQAEAEAKIRLQEEKEEQKRKQEERKNNPKHLAIMSLILGFVSYFSILAISVPLATSILGIVFGFKGFKSEKKKTAIAGIIINISFIVLFIAILVFA